MHLTCRRLFVLVLALSISACRCTQHGDRGRPRRLLDLNEEAPLSSEEDESEVIPTRVHSETNNPLASQQMPDFVMPMEPDRQQQSEGLFHQGWTYESGSGSQERGYPQHEPVYPPLTPINHLFRLPFPTGTLHRGSAPLSWYLDSPFTQFHLPGPSLEQRMYAVSPPAIFPPALQGHHERHHASEPSSSQARRKGKEKMDEGTIEGVTHPSSDPQRQSTVEAREVEALDSDSRLVPSLAEALSSHDWQQVRSKYNAQLTSQSAAISAMEVRFDEMWKEYQLHYGMPPAELAEMVTEIKLKLKAENSSVGLGSYACQKVERETNLDEPYYYDEFKVWSDRYMRKAAGLRRGYLESGEFRGKGGENDSDDNNDNDEEAKILRAILVKFRKVKERTYRPEPRTNWERNEQTLTTSRIITVWNEFLRQRIWPFHGMFIDPSLLSVEEIEFRARDFVVPGLTPLATTEDIKRFLVQFLHKSSTDFTRRRNKWRSTRDGRQSSTKKGKE